LVGQGVSCVPVGDGQKAWWRGVIKGLARLDKTKSAPDGNPREMGLADRGTRGPTGSGADPDSSHQARTVNRGETIVMPGHR
jgi:hypothetical protein